VCVRVCVLVRGLRIPPGLHFSERHFTCRCEACLGPQMVPHLLHMCSNTLSCYSCWHHLPLPLSPCSTTGAIHTCSTGISPATAAITTHSHHCCPYNLLSLATVSPTAEPSPMHSPLTQSRTFRCPACGQDAPVVPAACGQDGPVVPAVAQVKDICIE
jgi:hypothetical protein